MFFLELVKQDGGIGRIFKMVNLKFVENNGLELFLVSRIRVLLRITFMILLFMSFVLFESKVNCFYLIDVIVQIQVFIEFFWVGRLIFFFWGVYRYYLLLFLFLFVVLQDIFYFGIFLEEKQLVSNYLSFLFSLKI